MQSAMLNLASVETFISKSHRCRKPLQQLQKRLAKAQSVMNAAKVRHKLLKTRVDCIYDFLRQTENLRTAKHNAERHIILLRWMLLQVPLIEFESSKRAENDSGPRNMHVVKKKTDVFKITKKLTNKTRGNKASNSSSKNLKLPCRSVRIAERAQRSSSSLPRIQS